MLRVFFIIFLNLLSKYDFLKDDCYKLDYQKTAASLEFIDLRNFILFVHHAQASAAGLVY